MSTITIYIELLNEATECWRPVQSEHLGGDLYRIVDKPPDDEVWPFATGEIVKCEPRDLQFGGRELVAYERAASEPQA